MAKSVLCTVLAFIMMLAVAGCGGNQPDDGATVTSAESTAEVASTDSGTKVSWDDKYETPITLNVVLSLPQASHAEITEPSQTSYFKLAESELGIKLNILWSLPPDQYDQKFNLSLLSGDLPDIFSIPYGNVAVYNDLADSGAIWEIGEEYDDCLHPELLKYYRQPDVKKFKDQIEQVNGASYSYANVFDSKCNTPYWYIRKDYLDKLGLGVPGTVEELMDAAKKMSDAGLGTLGIVGGSDGAGFLPDVWGSMIPVFNCFGAYPGLGNWVVKDGKLESGLIQPEVRDGLLTLQAMYKDGALDKNFASKTSANFTEDVLNGRIGIFSGVWWHAAWPLTTMIKDDSKTDWIAVPVLPSAKVAAPKTSSVPFVASHFNMVSKSCKNPEALAKLLSMDYELQVNGVTRWGKEKAVDTYENNWKPLQLTSSIFDLEHSAANRVAFAKSKEEAMAVINEPGNMGSANLNIALSAIYKYKWEGSKADWGWYFSRAPEDSGLGLTEKLYRDNLVQTNPYVGPPLAADIEKGAALLTARNEAFARVIMGDPISTYDKFVESWKKNGGDEMTQQANEWYAKNK